MPWLCLPIARLTGRLTAISRWMNSSGRMVCTPPPPGAQTPRGFGYSLHWSTRQAPRLMRWLFAASWRAACSARLSLPAHVLGVGENVLRFPLSGGEGYELFKGRGSRSFTFLLAFPSFAPKVQTINGHAIGVSACCPTKDGWSCCLVSGRLVWFASSDLSFGFRWSLAFRRDNDIMDIRLGQALLTLIL